jgi:DNA-binding response OmpR family regulator
MLPSVSPSPPPLPELLFVDADATSAQYLALLREQYRVTTTSNGAGALQTLGRTAPALVVTELDLSDGPAEEICRRAKLLATPATVLVMTAQAERVPSALAAGCDAVLLKPFAPNLLYARLGRLLRARSIELRMRAHRQQAKSAHLKEQVELMAAKTNREWPNTHCPYCQHRGVTSFEYSSHRRSWYACMSCSKVWIAHRQE